jgi:hypothetical protein
MPRDIVKTVDGAVALRPVRILRDRDEIRHYSAVTFEYPRRGCDQWLWRLSLLGYVVAESDWMLDVLNEDDDIIQEVPITQKGFEYLRARWHFRWEREARWEYV